MLERFAVGQFVEDIAAQWPRVRRELRQGGGVLVVSSQQGTVAGGSCTARMSWNCCSSGRISPMSETSSSRRRRAQRWQQRRIGFGWGRRREEGTPAVQDALGASWGRR